MGTGQCNAKRYNRFPREVIAEGRAKPRCSLTLGFRGPVSVRANRTAFSSRRFAAAWGQ